MERVAVLASGGLDSCVLLADLARQTIVYPTYIEAGLSWEEPEKKALAAFIDAVANPNIQPVTILELPVGRIYGDHWSTPGGSVPEYEAPDSAVYLPGRNVLLIGVTAVWCALHDVSTIAIASLDENPFPDATPRFFDDYARLLSNALSHKLDVVAPYRALHKSELIERFADLPLHLTVTCMAPRVEGDEVVHCGACNKCRERKEAFLAARVPDRARYAK